MAYVIRMPKLGLEMDEGTLLEWHIETGEEVTEGELLAEVESEKSVGEIEAREDGVLREIHLEEGETAEPSTPIGILAEPDEDIADLHANIEVEGGEAAEASGGEDTPQASDAHADSASARTDAMQDEGSAAQSDVRASPRAKQRAEDLSVDVTTVEGTGPQGAITADDVEAAAQTNIKASPRAEQRAENLGVDIATVEGTGPQGAITADDVEAASEETETADEDIEEIGGRIFATPSVRQLARELGVDINTVAKSEQNGRITEADVRAAATEGETAAIEGDATTETPVETEPRSGDRTIREEKPFDGMRQTIADRLSQSYRDAVHVTEHREIDAETLFDAVDAANEAFEIDISMSDLLLLAVSATLSEHPGFNATFEDDVHRLYEEHNICVAVDVEAGLIAPVVRNVNTKQIPEIATDRRNLTERALSGDYTMDDLQGGTFTVTNLGVLGVESFDPIINPPQVAILGVNAIQQRAVPADEEVTFRHHLPLDLSFDHRVVDGADAARFLETLSGHIENPWPLIL
jgi:pyruvate/2-oxoglutarate dehydrogenase complex dihydrolipoamide acyltransferase (E2) component